MGCQGERVFYTSVTPDNCIIVRTRMFEILIRITCPCVLYPLKLRSHRAKGRETDKKSFHPFVSGRIRFMSVSNPVNPFLVR